VHEAAYWNLTGKRHTEGIPLTEMCNLYSITTNQAAIIALFRAINHNVGNLPPMPGGTAKGVSTNISRSRSGACYTND
jgi:hypothetical protein